MNFFRKWNAVIIGWATVCRNGSFHLWNMIGPSLFLLASTNHCSEPMPSGPSSRNTVGGTAPMPIASESS